ncbi:MAG: anaerobic ribonucleoside-triphosphate reductase activating protein [Deltaproteobacteria bacterium]|nr:anaerobic ribonucleoside-triphosphate reductase activating protein [Deltaproteobacteria bacterium]
MKIGGLQRVSLNDYPGKICATVFTQGCNFRCPYCHNPELVDPGQYGPVIPEEEVLSFLDKRRGKLEAVTVTGGEPALQGDLGEFLGALKKRGYLVKLDTNGSNPDTLSTMIDRRLVDYIAMDIKGPLDRYGQIASVKADTSRIRRSIQLVTTSGIEHEFRTTVVRSQLDLDDLLSMAKLIKKASPYVLQPFVATKTLDGAFLSETSYTPEEFSTIREVLGKKGVRVVVR